MDTRIEFEQVVHHVRRVMCVRNRIQSIITTYNTVWQKALDIITKINANTQIITELKKQKKIE
ncbi:MAG: hypothetical protein QXJ97_09825 [Desulfurococcaceae archaeon]